MDEQFEQFYAQYDDNELEDDSDDDPMAQEHDKHLLDQAVKDFENRFRVTCKMLVVCV